MELEPEADSTHLLDLVDERIHEIWAPTTSTLISSPSIAPNEENLETPKKLVSLESHLFLPSKLQPSHLRVLHLHQVQRLRSPWQARIFRLLNLMKIPFSHRKSVVTFVHTPIPLCQTPMQQTKNFAEDEWPLPSRIVFLVRLSGIQRRRLHEQSNTAQWHLSVGLRPTIHPWVDSSVAV
ncbi:hypothetical protein C8R42DRAFT_722735 [Lentinula raphanica]|nr:hypothetical protein C8R42DRAFT_722735 [Lentinula raphanica]